MNLAPSASAAFQRAGAFVAIALCAFLLAGCDGATDSFSVRAVRFFSLKDEFVRAAIAGSLLLGLNCGVLGCFLVTRRMSLVGDTLSHAILPGVVGGYLWNMTKDPVALLAGAVIAGIVASFLISALVSTTRLKPDAAQGIVLTVFFALGVCFISMLPPGNKAGLDRFLFGQIAAVDAQDVRWLLWSALATAGAVTVCYRGLMVLSFDEQFGRVAGLPMRSLHYLQMLLTTVAIVVAMEAVGVVLVAALLVIPAATASLLTQRLHWLILWSAGVGMFAAFMGTFLSFTGEKLAAGAMIVLSAAACFATAFCFSPRNGWVARWWAARRQAIRVRHENALKAVYRMLENREAAKAGAEFSVGELVSASGGSAGNWRRELQRLCASGLVHPAVAADAFTLTNPGIQAARRVVRNHRLWELYLTQRARYASDHVHEDAERMEHLLSDENVAHMMNVLGHPTHDPHGRPIPLVDAP